MRRHFCGILGVSALIGWVVLYFSGSNETSQAMAGGCLKAGLIFSALWLAYPQIESIIDRTPKWFFYALVGGLCAVAIRRELIILVIPIIIAFMILEGWKWLMTPPKRQEKSARRKKKRPTD
ncbi:MAG: hypothetical protein ACI9G1_001250 [Pirellulaceae bacterium]|jgi:hypothetical protein